MTARAARVTVVLLTHNCAHRLRPVLEQLSRFDGPVIAVDNASCDDTVALLHGDPAIDVIALEHNIGAAARNLGATRAATPYVAFCDDDGWYEPAGLARAADLLDAHPRLALVNARILVGVTEVLDPISAEMADSPLPEQDGIPGAVLLGFMAGACVVRRSAYLAVGGYDPEFFMGGEEEALALKLVAAGWRLRYCADVTMHHRPSRANVDALRAKGVRNALWARWLFRRPGSAIRSSLELIAERPRDRDLLRGLLEALAGLPWVLRRRHALPADVDAQLRTLDRHRRAWLAAHRRHAAPETADAEWVPVRG